MEELILPAIDRTDPLALEQAGIVTKFLKLFDARLDYAYDRNRFELAHYLGVAEALRADAEAISPAIAVELHAGVAEGRQLFELAGASLNEIRETTQRLGGVLTALVRTSAEADPKRRERIELTILTASKDLLDAQRAWFLPQGWESDARQVPPIEGAFIVPRPFNSEGRQNQKLTGATR
jgi:hypothetical protein